MQALIINEEKFNTSPQFYEDLIITFYHNNGDEFTKDELKIPTQLKNGVFYSVVINNGKIVSLARLSTIIIGGKARKTIYMLRQIDTLKEFRNKGYASCVIHNAVDYLSKMGYKRLLSIVDASNVSSMQLHLKNGFKISKPSKTFQKSHYYWDGEYFEKFLDKR